MAKPTEAELSEVLNTDAGFRYRLLDRMQSDCEYALMAGSNKHLWADGDPEKQIAYMRALYESFPDNEKPEWIDAEKINQYAMQIGGEVLAPGEIDKDAILTITKADIRWKDTGEVMEDVYFSKEDSEGHPLDSLIFFSGVDRDGMLNGELANEDFEILRVGETYGLDADGVIYGKDTVREQPDSLNAKAAEAQRACENLKDVRDDAGRDTQSFDR